MGQSGFCRLAYTSFLQPIMGISIQLITRLTLLMHAEHGSLQPQDLSLGTALVSALVAFLYLLKADHTIPMLSRLLSVPTPATLLVQNLAFADLLTVGSTDTFLKGPQQHDLNFWF